jgi:hypothetical protein
MKTAISVSTLSFFLASMPAVAQDVVATKPVEVHCGKTLDREFKCSDGTLVDAKITDNGRGKIEGRVENLLTITAMVNVSECSGQQRPGGYDPASGGTVGGQYLDCIPQPYPDVNYVPTGSAEECARVGKILAYRKWATLQRRGWNANVVWSCE